MSEREKYAPFRMLVLISTPKLADKAAEMFKQGAVPLQYEWNAVGTASSEMIDVLGLGNPSKMMLASFLPKPMADLMLKKLKKELRLGTINSGIAFTMPLSGANHLIVKLFADQENFIKKEMQGKGLAPMSEIKYALIVVVVNQGYSENVMDAAREAGANGGTVVTSRRIGNEQALGFWGMSIQNEKDMVFIVTENENKLEIMKAIGEKCGMHSEAQGVLVSLPIDQVIGFDTSE